MNGLALIVPNWNGEAHLARLFASLEAQTLKPDRVLVVDNGSRDGSAALTRSRGFDVLTLGRNLGFASAVNRGIAATTGEWVGILNNDVTLAPDYLERLAGACAGGSYRESGFATGKIFRAGSDTTLDGTWDLLSRGCLPWRAGHGKPDGPLWDRARPIRSAPLTAAVFHRRVLEETGGLDERFGSYIEDVDLGIRCGLAGIRGCYVPEARAWHWGSATLGVWRSETVRLQSRNQLILAAKYFPAGWWKRLGRPLVAGQLLWGGLALRHGCFLPWARGKVEAMTHWNVVRRESARFNRESAASALFEDECEIVDLQRQTGFDRFWMWYRRVAGDVH